MKKLISAILAFALAVTLLFGGCGLQSGGADGRDGQDLNIYDIYQAACDEREKEGLDGLSFLDFLKEYLAGVEVGTSPEQNLQAFINRSLLSAVAIKSRFYYTSRYGTRYYAEFAGSGVIVEKSADAAYILTNCHVVYCDISNGSSVIPDDGIANPVLADDIFIYSYSDGNVRNQTGAKATIVGASDSYDIALLAVSGSSFDLRNALCADFAAGEEVYVGEQVYTVGNPDGGGLAVTRGIVSRDSEFITMPSESNPYVSHTFRVIRTDAAVNGGNSGGGLFNSSGQLVGLINSKKVDTASEDFENIGYALGGSYVKRIYKLFLDGYGSPTAVGLRLAVFPGTVEYTSSAYFDSSLNITRVVDNVVVRTSGGGFKTGDVLKRIKVLDSAGQTVEDVGITRAYLADDVLLSARDGGTVVYTVSRDGAETEITTSPQFSSVS